MDFPPPRTAGSARRPAEHEDDMVAVYVSRHDIRDLDAGELGVRIAAAIAQPRTAEPNRAPIAEFEPPPVHTIQDVLSGHITWDELTDHQVA